MRWLRRVPKVLFWLGVATVALPVIALGICACLVVVLSIGAVVGVGRLSVNAWNGLPRNRRAIGRAQEALTDLLPGRFVVNWHVARRDPEKCFVHATLTGFTQPPTLWLCAVWDDGGRVDDLGTWQFRNGVRVRHAARAYQRSRAAGVPWPTGIGELVLTAPPAELPATARPGLHPHEGSVLVRVNGEIRCYADVAVLPDVLTEEETETAEAYDAECRPLRFGMGRIVEAPFPPEKPDKVFVERLRHRLMSQTGDDATRERLRKMLPAELADYGLSQYGGDGGESYEEEDEEFDEEME